MRHPETLEPILRFLGAANLPCAAGLVPSDSFLPGVQVQAGVLVYDADRLGSPGDLLHEAGHLASAPSVVRHRLDGDVDASIDAILADADAPLSDAERHQLRHSEAQAIAWSYAAALAAGVPPQCVFWGEGYGGGASGAPQLVMMQLAQGLFPGITLLAGAGLCSSPPPFGDPADPAPYPHMRRWLAS